jgi:hypothetical protein
MALVCSSAWCVASACCDMMESRYVVKNNVLGAITPRPGGTKIQPLCERPPGSRVSSAAWHRLGCLLRGTTRPRLSLGLRLGRQPRQPARRAQPRAAGGRFRFLFQHEVNPGQLLVLAVSQAVLHRSPHPLSCRARTRSSLIALRHKPVPRPVPVLNPRKDVVQTKDKGLLNAA